MDVCAFRHVILRYGKWKTTSSGTCWRSRAKSVCGRAHALLAPTAGADEWSEATYGNSVKARCSRCSAGADSRSSAAICATCSAGQQSCHTKAVACSSCRAVTHSGCGAAVSSAYGADSVVCSAHSADSAVCSAYSADSAYSAVCRAHSAYSAHSPVCSAYSASTYTLNAVPALMGP